jgi:FkbM family methyltransferase
MNNLSLKTNILNYFRSVTKISAIETFLASSIRNDRAGYWLFKKLILSHKNYPLGSFRSFTDHQINWRLDISDYIAHTAYFGLDRSTDKLFELCKKDSIVFDIGVNIGCTALRMSQICSEGRVYGFEPDKQNFSACMDNINLNPQVRNLQLSPIALGSESGMVSMTVTEPRNRGGNHISATSNLSQSEADIPMVSLDAFVANQHISQINVIKIDTEGFEFKILQGAKVCLTKFKPSLFIELNHGNLQRQGDSATAMIQLLNQLGYKKITDAFSGAPISSFKSLENVHIDIIAIAD